jgi:hypothetical protein
MESGKSGMNEFILDRKEDPPNHDRVRPLEAFRAIRLGFTNLG